MIRSLLWKESREQSWRFVFLLLAAQYESWSLPFSVLLSTPTVILGTMIGLLVISSILNGLTVIWENAHVGAAILFLSGMLFLLFGIACAIAELLSALDVVESETRLVNELADEAAMI